MRTLCEHCKKPDDSVTRETLLEVIKPWRLNGGMRPYKPVGCLECRMTGFLGRVGIYEVLTCSPEIKELISEGGNEAKIRQLALKEGMRPLRLSGALKVAAGLTTIEEVAKVAPPSRDALRPAESAKA